MTSLSQNDRDGKSKERVPPVSKRAYVCFEAWTSGEDRSGPNDYGHVEIRVRKMYVHDAAHALAVCLERTEPSADSQAYYTNRLTRVIKACGCSRHFHSGCDDPIEFTCQANGDSDKSDGQSYYALGCTRIDVCDEWQVKLLAKLGKALAERFSLATSHLALIDALKQIGAIQVENIEHVISGYSPVPCEKLTYPIAKEKADESAA